MLIELFSAVATVLALIGVWLNNRRRIWCFYLWLVSNSMCMGLHANAHLWIMSFRDLAFIILAIEGAIRWRRQEPRGARAVKDAETIKRLRNERDALEAMVAAFENAP